MWRLKGKKTIIITSISKVLNLRNLPIDWHVIIVYVMCLMYIIVNKKDYKLSN